MPPTYVSAPAYAQKTVHKPPESKVESARPGAGVAELVEVMDRLLAPDGCPWDREQTLATLAPYLVEETYEVLEAIDTADPHAHCEELGDLLLQIVFQSALQSRSGHFDVEDVANAIVTKMRRRHPHVFGDGSATNSAEVRDTWERIKADEKGPRRVLEGVPIAMPALSRAQKISSIAARVGFDWPDVEACTAKVEEELEELRLAQGEQSPARVEEELGDLLFATVSLARKLGVDSESALRKATTKFEHRFRYVEDCLEQSGRDPRSSTLDEMDELWNQSKERTWVPEK